MAPLARRSGVSCVTVQLDVRPEELAAFAPARPYDAAAHIRDWGDTAALIEALDLVVTVDTAVAHLAGALGRPVWVLVPFAPDWRWLLGRSDSPWYPTLRLFRQPEPGDWTSVLQAVGEALSRTADGPGVFAN
jgi:ADP-heptose:LPS heptosyltransferase